MNNEQWGNIELPGLSDEELLNKNWNKITGAREAVKAREKNGWKEKNEERYQDPEYGKKVGKSISATYSTELGRKKQAIKSKPHKQETKEKIAKAFIGKARPPEVVEKIKQSRKGQATTFKPIVTPIGIFMRMQDAVKPTGISIGRLRKYTRTLPWSEDYYHISIEEYQRRTGIILDKKTK